MRSQPFNIPMIFSAWRCLKPSMAWLLEVEGSAQNNTLPQEHACLFSSTGGLFSDPASAEVVAEGPMFLCRVSTSHGCAQKSRCARYLTCCNSWLPTAVASRFMVLVRCMRWRKNVAVVFQSTSRRPGFTATNAGSTAINWNCGQRRQNSRSMTPHLNSASDYRGNRPGSIVGKS